MVRWHVGTLVVLVVPCVRLGVVVVAGAEGLAAVGAAALGVGALVLVGVDAAAGAELGVEGHEGAAADGGLCCRALVHVFNLSHEF